MANYFTDVKFKYKFRDYQQNFLNNIQEHLADNKIHVVAAPGAGKTILALEMCRELGEKALIIVPSIALKEQWIERLKKDFTGTDTKGFISSDLKENTIVTVITYQMLHAMVRRKDNVSKIITENNIKTIVLDECHHMRRVWFISLKNVVEALKNIKLISLTATPPYDNGPEFRNYMELCGDIDERITAGQLVKSNCLCPHQDYIYFNLPTKKQNELMANVNKFADSLMDEIKHREDFITAVAMNELVINPTKNDILKDFKFYIALCSFLNSLGIKYDTVNIEFTPPPFDKEKLSLILERYLYDKISEAKIIKDYLTELKNRLEIEGCLKDKHIDLTYSEELTKKILVNSGKLNSICDIVNIEYKNLGNNLNMAICTDFIKDEYYKVQDEEEIDQMGVVPIFRKIRTQCPQTNIIVLTGSLIYIPSFLEEKLKNIAYEEYKILPEEITIKELGIDFDYSLVDITDSKRKYAVNILTKLLQTKDVHVLIGTIALIGEGWDAPFVNSLIIASSVSTYVTSNQVRGRAIRIDSSSPDKVANIWHLVTMENNGNYYYLKKDYNFIHDRFTGVEGLNSAQNIIEMGIDRLNIKRKFYSKEDVIAENANTIQRASNRNLTKESWQKALKNYTPEYYERVFESIIERNHYTKVKIFNKLKVQSLTGHLVSALKKTKILPPQASFKIKHRRNKGYDIILLNSNTHDQIIFAEAVKQQYDITDRTRYVVLHRNKIYPVPEILGKKKELAENYKKSLRLPFSKLVYIKSEEGKDILLKSKLNNLDN